MIKVAVVGATGYTGEELVDVLLRNPEVEITSLARFQDKEEDFAKTYPRFANRINLVCGNMDVDRISKESDFIFLALPHTESMKVVPEFLKRGKRVVDLSGDYRLPADIYEKWYGTKHVDAENLSIAVYGLPEINREKIKKANFVSNPGCYPTSVVLGLLPIAKAASEGEIIVDSKSGMTGAGRKAVAALLANEGTENFKSYKENNHQHIPEMEKTLAEVTGGEVKVNFTPHLLPIQRGILSTIYVKSDSLPSEDEIHKMYADKYKDEPFVRVRPLGEMPEIKDVVGTNFCDIGIKYSRGLLIIVSVIDNLLKGASGQAVQNMNIMCGFDERAGLI